MKKGFVRPFAIFCFIIAAGGIGFLFFRKTPIPIGMTACLSGRLSQMGISARNGVDLAIASVNNSGGIKGRPLELHVRNNNALPADVHEVIEAFEDEGVRIIIGPMISKMAIPFVQAASGKDILFISPTVSSDALKDSDDAFLRIGPLASNQALTLLDVVRKNGHRKLALVYDLSNQGYTVPMIEIVKKTFHRNGEFVVYDHPIISGSDEGFLDIARGIGASGADALIMCLSGIDAALLCQQIHKTDDRGLMVYGTSWAKTNDFLIHGGQSVEGVILVSGFESKVKSDSFLAFQDVYKKRYQAEPSFVSVRAYEAAMVAVEGLRNASSANAAAVKAAILKQSTFTGLEQTFSMNAFGDTDRDYSVFIVRNSRYEKVD